MIYKVLILFILSTSLFELKAADQKPSDCGKLLSTVLKVDSAQKKASFEKFYFLDEEFCDLGKDESLANYDLLLFDKYKKNVNEKSVFLNPVVIIEEVKDKNSNKFSDHKVAQLPQVRIVKFSILGKVEDVVSYKIIAKSDKSILGSGEVVIEKK